MELRRLASIDLSAAMLYSAHRDGLYDAFTVARDDASIGVIILTDDKPWWPSRR